MDVRNTLPSHYIEEPFLLSRVESLREWPEYPIEELQCSDSFSVRFKKVEMRPSSLLEKNLPTSTVE